MSCIVAIETSTEHCSVALKHNGELQTLRAAGVRQHAEFVLPMLSRLLSEAGLPRSAIDVIGYGRGPGAFTGVRLAVAIAQGLGFALDRPTFGVSSLQACASMALLQASDSSVGVSAASQIVAILDARMGEFYVAAFTSDKRSAPKLSGQECLLTPDLLQAWLAERGSAIATFAGNGLSVLKPEFFAGFTHAQFLPDVRPDAEEIAKLTALGFAAKQAVPARFAQPAYVRDKVADTLLERAAKRAGARLSAAL
jgi:tRNA threonylcarbamoyladenosine biosynthesis protein TsaB